MSLATSLELFAGRVAEEFVTLRDEMSAFDPSTELIYIEPSTTTAAFQTIIDGITGGARVFLKPGTHTHRAVDWSGVSGVTVFGVRGRSIVKYDSAGAGANDSLFYWNAWGAPGTNDRAITIRDLTFEGTGTLAEQQALLHLSAVDDVLVENCDFRNMTGDGINLARTTMGGSDTGVHNRRVRIRGNLFDGAYIGRNGVTIIDGDDVLIEGNTFTRCAHPSMPGAIDIEPNSFDTSAICRDIRIIDNTFKDNGGFVADVGLAFIPTTPTTMFDRIRIEGNIFGGTLAATTIEFRWVLHAATTGDAEQNLVVRNNYIGPPNASNARTLHQAIYLRGVKGVDIDWNTFVGWPRRAVGMVGAGTSELVREVRINWNTFRDVGATSGYIVNLDYAQGISVYDNTSEGSSTLSAFVAVMQAYDVDRVRVVRNRLRNVNNALHFGPTAQPAQTTPTGNISALNESLVGQVNVAGMATGTLPSSGSTTVAAADITDSTATGRSVLTATDAAAARTAIGAGTSSLALGTTSTTAKAGDYQPTAANISDATATGRSVLTAATAAAARTAIGAGTSDLAIGTTGTTAAAGNHGHAAAAISDSTAVGRSVLTAVDAAAARTAIGAGTSSLALGTTGTTAAAGDHGHAAASISDSTATGRSVLTAASAAAARTAIGAGTSDLAIGTTGTTAAAGNHGHAAAGITDSTAVGRSILTAADAAAVRTASGAGRVDSTDGTILNVIKLTQAQYDALGTKVATTLYVIVG